ncbi:MAG: carbohydrate ABC transporter permease [Clostridia bacterium]|nr:carbohydrate ABC transporter permease [Clostridia bacterium]
MTQFTASPVRNRSTKSTVGWIALLAFMILCAVAALFPFVWMISSSLKLETEMFIFPIQWIPKVFHWENYYNAWTMVDFPGAMLNSLFVAGTITVGQVLTSATAGYAFAKIDFRGRDKVFLGYLATMMVPFQVVMIPQFILFRKLGLTNTHWALILPGMFTVFGVFMLRQFFQGIPDEMIEAARLDGCTEFGILMRIVLPLSKAALSSLAIFTFRWQWNDYLAPLIYLNDKPKFTLTIALAQFKMENITLYTLIMAGSVITLIPVVVLFMFTQKYLIQGITMTGMKG